MAREIDPAEDIPGNALTALILIVLVPIGLMMLGAQRMTQRVRRIYRAFRGEPRNGLGETWPDGWLVRWYRGEKV